METMQLEIRELTPELWPQLEELFGQNGACGGCWCWWWRLAQGEHWEEVRGAEAHARLRRLVQEGHCHGLLAFEGKEPVGWCSFEPRTDFPRLARARFLKGDPSGRGLVDRLLLRPCLLPPRRRRRRSACSGRDCAAEKGSTHHRGLSA